MEDGWIPNHAKIPLQLKRHIDGLLSQQGEESSETSAVILDSHDPALEDTIDIGLGEFFHIDQVNLEPVAIIVRVDGLLRTLLRRDFRITLHTCRTGLDIMATHQLSDGVVLGAACSIGPLNTHVSIRTVGIIDHVEDVILAEDDSLRSLLSLALVLLKAIQYISCCAVREFKSRVMEFLDPIVALPVL